MENIIELNDQNKNKLTNIATKINGKQDVLESSMKSTLMTAWEMGELLIDAKALVKHGEWAGWLKDNVAVKPSQCKNYMKLRNDFESNSQLTGFLSIDEALGYTKPKKEKEIVNKAPKAQKGNPESNGAMIAREFIDSGYDFSVLPEKNGHTGRIKKIHAESLELLDKVASGEMSVEAAKLATDHAALERKQTQEAHDAASEEDLKSYADSLFLLASQDNMIGLGDWAQQSLWDSRSKVEALMERATKSSNKATVPMLFELVKHMEMVQHSNAIRSMPIYIEEEKAKLERDRNNFEREKNEFNLRAHGTQTRITKEELKVLRSFVHPDKHIGNEEKARKAFVIFTKLCEA